MTSTKPSSILALDVGSKRIGVARASAVARLPEALKTIVVDGSELDSLNQIIEGHNIDTIVVGWPRNMSGEETKQTLEVSKFIDSIASIGCTIVKQDEALTSVEAEKELIKTKRSFTKADIDAGAAIIILNDYLRTLPNEI